MSNTLTLTISRILIIWGSWLFPFYTKAAEQKLVTETMSHIHAMSAKPHPFGSYAQKEVATYITKTLKNKGAKYSVQKFHSATPKGPKDGINIIAPVTINSTKNCQILLGSHYDSKEKSPGANDSGSSSALLLTLWTYMQSQKLTDSCAISFVWFDGEEATLKNWQTGYKRNGLHDNTYGSRFFVSTLQSCGKLHCWQERPVKAFLLLDMIGSPNLQFSLDSYSDKRIVHLAKQFLNKKSAHFAPPAIAIADDHLPFVKLGIPSLVLVDWNHLEHWHKASDVADNISTESLKITLNLTQHLLKIMAKAPF